MEFRAVVTRVVDGDTVDCLADLGFNAYQFVTVRLRNVDTPELRDKDPELRAAAQLAKKFTVSTLLNRPVLVTTYKDATTFGRYVADIEYQTDDGQLLCINEQLRLLGHSK
jgi:micrococcal nuclease